MSAFHNLVYFCKGINESTAEHKNVDSQEIENQHHPAVTNKHKLSLVCKHREEFNQAINCNYPKIVITNANARSLWLLE